jgi:hypothetical protein
LIRRTRAGQHGANEKNNFFKAIAALDRADRARDLEATAKSLGRMSDDMARFANGQGATAVVTRIDAEEAEVRRKAAGRRQLAALVEQINDSIKGDLISGIEGAKIDGLIARVMEGLAA